MTYFDQFFILYFLMTIYYFLIIKNISFFDMRKYKIVVYRKIIVIE